MNVSLTPELKRFVAGKVKTGMYQTASEVVREALRDWKMKRARRLQELEGLRGDIDKGLSDAAGGLLTDFDAGRIVERGRQLLARTR